jgi:hypothetical protein
MRFFSLLMLESNRRTDIGKGTDEPIRYSNKVKDYILK